MWCRMGLLTPDWSPAPSPALLTTKLFRFYCSAALVPVFSLHWEAAPMLRFLSPVEHKPGRIHEFLAVTEFLLSLGVFSVCFQHSSVSRSNVNGIMVLRPHRVQISLCKIPPQHFKHEFLCQSNDLGLRLPSSSAWFISFHTRKLFQKQ